MDSRAPRPYEDAVFLAQRLRACDRAEVLALAGDGCDVTAMILASINASGDLCWTVCNGPRPVFVIGCAYDEHSQCGQPWLLATDEVYRFPGALTRLTKQYVAQMLERHGRLLNYVDERNVASARWLERIGFTVGEPFVLGRQGESFHPFSMGM